MHDLDPDDNFYNEVYQGLSLTEVSPYYSIENYNSSFKDSPSSLNIFSFNVRSFKRNGELFTSFLKSLYKLPDIVVLTETWIDNIDKDTYAMEGYNEFHTIREHGRSGGVTIYSSGSLSVRPVNELTLCSETIETCVVECIAGGEEFILFAIYRPHSDSIDQFCNILNVMLNSPLLRNKPVIVLGDLNIDLLKSYKQNICNFMETMQSLSYIPLITKATRFPNTEETGTPSLLDHVWTNSLKRFSSGIIAVDLTDHCPVFLNLPVHVCIDKKIKLTFRVHSPTAIEEFKGKLRDWLEYVSFEVDINTLTEEIINGLNRLYISCFPLKTKWVSPKRLSKPWLTSAILNSIKTKAQYFKWSKLGLISNELNRQYRNKLNSVIRIAKQRYFLHLFELNKNDIKQTWKVIKKLLSQSPRVKRIKNIMINGNIKDDSSDIVNGFSDYFAGIAKSLDSKIPRTNQSPLVYVSINRMSSFFINSVSSREISQIILGLKNASGNTNEIPVRLLKHVHSLLSVPVAKLVNKSFLSGVFPSALKVARVVPIFKSGDSQCVSNYRPISVLPLFSKIIERCMAQRLLAFIRKFNIITPDQFGFLKGKSTTDAFIKLTEYIYSCLNNKQHSRGIFIDLRKAFDTVNHEVLVKKLEMYGVRGLPLLWFNSYLRDRKQSVSINGHCSSEETISVGVPQGSILGPILFLLYINDISNVSNLFSVILYADDTTLLANNSDYATLMRDINNELPKLQEWLNANRLSLNLDKTFTLLFSNRYADIDPELMVIYSNEAVKFKDKGEFLGLTIDDNLRFNTHIQVISNKISKSVGIFYRLRHCVPRRVHLNLYYTMVYPYLLYGNIVWGGTSVQHIRSLQLLQKKIVRIITNSGYLEHTSPLFKQMKILKIIDLHRYLLCIYMFTLKQNNHRMFVFTHGHYTRNRNNARPSFQRLTLTQKSLSFAAPQAWNDLPHRIRDLDNYNIFKRELKAHFIDAY